MDVYDVYHHPFYGTKLIKRGYSLIATVFPFFWLLFNRLWKESSILFLIFTAVILSCIFIEDRADSIVQHLHSMSQEELNDDPDYGFWYRLGIDPVFDDMTASQIREKNRSLYIDKKIDSRVMPLYYTALAMVFLLFLAHIFVGFKARAWYAENLEKRGFKPKKVITASSKGIALAKLYSDS